jgi:hypothetical protein
VKKSSKLSWKPKLRGEIYCSPACGANCTHAAFLAAQAAADKLAYTLNHAKETFGVTWVPHVWENCGWHAGAISWCKRWHVVANRQQGRCVTSYTAFLSSEPTEHFMGDWSDSARTAAGAAIRALSPALRLVGDSRG